MQLYKGKAKSAFPLLLLLWRICYPLVDSLSKGIKNTPNFTELTVFCGLLVYIVI